MACWLKDFEIRPVEFVPLNLPRHFSFHEHCDCDVDVFIQKLDMINKRIVGHTERRPVFQSSPIYTHNCGLVEHSRCQKVCISLESVNF